MVVVVTDVLIDRVWGLVLDIGATFAEQWLDIGIRKCQGSPVDRDENISFHKGPLAQMSGESVSVSRLITENVLAEGIPRARLLYGDKQYEASTSAKQTSPYAIRLELRETRRLNYRTIGFICLE
jgi:hypothetical protein